MFVLAVTGHRTRRIRVPGAAPHPATSRVAQAAGTWSWAFRTPDAGHGC
jgi:hypothetical protein